MKIPFVYIEASDFKNGYAVVCDKNRKAPAMNLINKDGKKVLEEDYDSIKLCDEIIIFDEQYYCLASELKARYTIEEKQGHNTIIKSFDSIEERDLYFEIYLNEVNKIEDAIANIRISMYSDLDKKVEQAYSLNK